MGVSEDGISGRDGVVAAPTKTGLAEGASAKWRAGLIAAAALVSSALLLGACGDHGAEGKDCPPSASVGTISGFCVPRYVSLKRDKVYARKGPGTDYPAVWIYHARDLPVQIVAETLDWRRICDPYGGAVWVHRSMLDGRRTVQAVGADPIALLHAPREGAHVDGLLKPRAVANLDRCRGGWCKLKVDGVDGWVLAAQVWGTAPAAQCR
jgi:SH3-like domain-containing protein